ncbi:indole-3-glycerol phosphate synthase TrpC [Pedobacter sp. HMF7647]|uniref:Indole-3-glycerol phosphate synthase n=1 Tax=Hufsiella arboris TaxID=2695275 RepID=A0A7K1YAG5_9SPHI|nr:indole-3-glycerol phosphate synthase TrpC [Hufsiella arboris]MXV51572.1 indole-3-glycerol phosphate synthase TrpC [Hufsiella arboris]
MTILDKIVEQKLREIKFAKSHTSTEELQQSTFFNRECYNLNEFILNDGRNGVIAEFKRASPSKGIINDTAEVQDVAKAYAASNVSAISVLTDNVFFKGFREDLMQARTAVDIPLLRKDFMLDEYQVLEAKAWGADIILLIAAILSPERIKTLAAFAKNLGLNILLEVHNQEELDRSICDDLTAIGVNNRNLADFTVSLEHSYELVSLIPDEFLKVSESGISNTDTINELKSAGFNGFLIGENFMKESDPAQAVKEFTGRL